MPAKGVYCGTLLLPYESLVIQDAPPFPLVANHADPMLHFKTPGRGLLQLGAGISSTTISGLS